MRGGFWEGKGGGGGRGGVDAASPGLEYRGSLFYDKEAMFTLRVEYLDNLRSWTERCRPCMPETSQISSLRCIHGLSDMIGIVPFSQKLGYPTPPMPLKCSRSHRNPAAATLSGICVLRCSINAPSSLLVSGSMSSSLLASSNTYAKACRSWSMCGMSSCG